MADDIVQRHLDRYAKHLDTRAIQIERGAVESCYDRLDAHLEEGPWLVAADDRTWEAAGAALTDYFDRIGQPWVEFHVETQPEYDHPVCTDALVESCRERMDESGCTAGIAVGSGTINDTVKMAAHRLGRPMAVVGTAPSMNGYTSGVASILSDGVKTTHPCTAPRVVIADLDCMAEAPERMMASGFADLMSKPVSNSDWAISARLNGTPHSEEAQAIIGRAAESLEGVAPKLPERDREAVRGLVEALMLSGIAMSVAGSSSPASGGEHLVSHYIDMTAHAFGEPYDLHGCQVGVGTLCAAHLYERLRAFDPDALEIEARVEALPDWEDYRATLRERYDALFDAVVTHAEPAYPTPERLRRRLESLVDQWDAIMEEASKTLVSPDVLERELRAAHSPVRFRDLGVERDRARRAILHSKDIRDRYTILDLCWEIGRLETWGDEALDRYE
jgi:glycerol-1-phosphate dehydrogenase [NAD(P)+]